MRLSVGCKEFAKCVAAFFICLLLTVPAALAEGSRWAVVVGNGTYENPSVPSLDNTTNDARTMAASLRNMGFDVFLLENAKEADLNDTISILKKEHSGADLGVFFFAGHGLQLNGVNYVLPTDLDPSQPGFLEKQGLPLNRLIGSLSETGLKNLVVILDACRNSPFGDDGAYGTGLALVDAPQNAIIAYSTAPGAVALDGSGANSPFTAALAATLEGPRQDLRDVLKLVRAKVRFATGGAQTPWFIDNSREEMIIQPREAVQLDDAESKLVSGDISLESTAWRTISHSSDTNDFLLFARLYPDHPLAAVAREQVTILRNLGSADLPKMDIGAGYGSSNVPDGLSDEITDCDILATGVGDIYGLVEPVPHDLVNTRAALRACIEATTEDRKNPRLLGLLARVLKLEKRYDEARYYYLSAAEEGNSGAYGGLADLYRFGLGVPQDLQRAAGYARKGALMGNAPLRVLMGVYYKQGWGVPQSFEEARRWTEIASYTGFASAHTALGDFYRRGQGVEKDPATALTHFQMAAALGQTDAMNNIGMAYMRGDGVEADTTIGITWLSRASELGNPYSAFHLGRAFRKGWGVEQDARQALAYFRLSAQRNFLGAYVEIGDLLQGEGGIEENLPEAYASYMIAIKAAELRDTIASDENKAEAITKMEALKAKMTDDQVAKGTQLALDWIDQYGLLDFNLVSE
ncbi:caspase family protein [Ostreiculturibacter nitratireducens]|uniref:caspase family protein n=1 Tax=Ostreiculturibacter nitratireducens TaxID=3075226 RepID=UPI0031B56EE2